MYGLHELDRSVSGVKCENALGWMYRIAEHVKRVEADRRIPSTFVPETGHSGLLECSQETFKIESAVKRPNVGDATQQPDWDPTSVLHNIQNYQKLGDPLFCWLLASGYGDPFAQIADRQLADTGAPALALNAQLVLWEYVKMLSMHLNLNLHNLSGCTNTLKDWQDMMCLPQINQRSPCSARFSEAHTPLTENNPFTISHLAQSSATSQPARTVAHPFANANILENVLTNSRDQQCSRKSQNPQPTETHSFFQRSLTSTNQVFQNHPTSLIISSSGKQRKRPKSSMLDDHRWVSKKTAVIERDVNANELRRSSTVQSEDEGDRTPNSSESSKPADEGGLLPSGARICQRIVGRRPSFRLSQFLRHLLNNSDYNPDLICWVDKTRNMFKLVNSAAVARLWGAHKQKPNMNYETMGRAMRYYYAQNILRKVKGQRLVYQFLEEPRGYTGRVSLDMPSSRSELVHPT
ncbi:hypothetical protein CSKR_105626 [Clonorchis sinensis]|uniref:Uncharacterized protein n=1 Tax=Clonorchis sinensis TaxID=79923 RepID=A0A3R7GW36_CLOSI|nr:hypothetical protein CSKR_105626 [Clonorchis sinensis]